MRIVFLEVAMVCLLLEEGEAGALARRFRKKGRPQAPFGTWRPSRRHVGLDEG
jgi:hypothetical protein